ncbi:threonine-phosphate decarboxylase CobD [Paenibacillus thailandensis]|uniref:threonine-phosphate decarboxylase n=1 Tax=Paenibacillus thailandensis TaxID=393250 RepID=A0ABW5R0Z3_9BACL
MLERYGHGGDLTTAAEAYGRQEDEFVDFSSNMNPLGPPEAVRRELVRYAERIAAYPDPAVRRLRAKLAARYGISEEAILAGNGAAELIDLAVRAFRPGTVALPMPSFGEYADAVRKAGGRIIPVPLRPESDFTLDERAFAEAESASSADMLFIGSPNNPTGRLADPSLILKLAERGGIVIVDEAFIDFVPDEERYTLIREAAVRPNLFVIRSMTKFYAVPGIRLGYMVGSPAGLDRLRGLQIPWSVNSLAQRIGEAVLDDAAFAAETHRWLQREKPRLAGKLKQLGMHVYPSDANYLLARLPEAEGLTAASLQREMGRRGVLIRDASRFDGLDGRYCRFAVKLREHNDRLAAALGECLRLFL